MLRPGTRRERWPNVWSKIAAAMAGSLMAGALSSAQDLGTSASRATSLVPAVRHVTLEQAQQAAAQANALMAQLAQLEVEAATQARLAAAADYYPKFGLFFWNAHFNKFLGQEILVNRPIVGGTFTAAFPLLGQDQTLITVTATQPITPLFKVREAVALARADENIARAKAGLQVVSTTSAVEKNYFDLLIAQKEMSLAEGSTRNARGGGPVASAVAVRLEQPVVETRDGNRTVQQASARVRQLTASLNALLGWPTDTPLELEAPAPLAEMIALDDAVAAALAGNPEVIEAEQKVEKAEAASKLSKLDYIPDIAVMGGYVRQDDLIPLLPEDFSFIAVFGSYNIFDFGKREHSLRARNAQVQMARAALELTKAKVAAAVQTTYLDLEQSRRMSEMAGGASRAGQLVDVNFDPHGADVPTAQTLISLELLRLDAQHRAAYAKLREVTGQR